VSTPTGERVQAAALPAAAPVARGAWIALAIFTLINLVNYLDRYVLAGMLPLVQAHFGRTDAQMGILSSSFLVVYAVVSPFTGFLGDRASRKHIVAAGAILWSAATVWSGFARTFDELLLARSFIGIGEAGYAAVAPGYLADLFEERRRGRILALFYAALPVGSALGFTLGGVIGTAYGWRAAFLVAGIPGALLGVAALFLREPRRGAADGGARFSPARIGAIVRTLAASPGFRFNTAGYTAATFAMGGVAAWWPTFLERERGVPLDRGGFLFGAVLVVAGFLGTLCGGWLGDRLHARDRGGHFRAAGWGLVAAFPFAAAGVLLRAPGLYWPAIFVALFFLFFNTAPLNAVLVNVAPPSMRASAVAINVLVIHLLGDAISPWLMGLVSDASHLGLAVLLDCGMILVAGVILLLGTGALRRELERRAAP